MNLTKEFRAEIAHNIIGIAAPVGFFGFLICCIGILLFGGQQYHRLISPASALTLVITAWILNKMGKPLISMSLIIACIFLGIISGMALSGGIHSLSYTGTLVAITVVTVIYGIRGGVVFLILAAVLGLLFSFLIGQGILHPVDKPTTTYLFIYYMVLLGMQFTFVLIPFRFMVMAVNDRKQARDESSIEPLTLFID